MTPPFDAAPISSLPSGRLRFAAGYFTLSGGLACASGVLNLTIGAFRGTLGFNRVSVAAVILAYGLMLLWIAAELRAQRRRGWYAALVVVSLPLIAVAISRTGVHVLTVAISVIGVVVLLSVRDELK